MQALINFFVTLGNVIVSLIEFIISFISDLIFVIGLVGNLIIKLPPMLTYWLPSPVVSLLIVAFGLVVTYKILGREG